LRYPVDKESLTGINYEPWHYRYVGTKAAKYIMKHKLCLEEYVTMLEEETTQSASDSSTETTAAVEADG
ncbi:MAG: D-alanyl-D-alanine carboxypeptidase family protein, partial [Clostridia bacterium]|nr:D-alanyl-D-alanine carboxypeptidase family protein [Clostridia bacterium]